MNEIGADIEELSHLILEKEFEYTVTEQRLAVLRNKYYYIALRVNPADMFDGQKAENAKNTSDVWGELEVLDAKVREFRAGVEKNRAKIERARAVYDILRKELEERESKNPK